MYETTIVVRKTLKIDPSRIPEVQKAVAEGIEVRFTNSILSGRRIIFDGKMDFNLPTGGGEKVIEMLQSKGRGLIDYKGGLYQYAVVVAMKGDLHGSPE